VHILLGITITPKTRNASKGIYIDNDGITPKNQTIQIEPDSRLEDLDLSFYFHYWYHRIPQWKVSGKAVLDLDKTDFSLYQVWLQAFSQFQFDIDINRLKEGEIFKFNLEYHINFNIPARWKKYFISLCPICKKAVNIHLSRPIKYCPNCARIKDANKQRLRRAIKRGQHLCKCCGKPLPKEYPNRDYCPGGACKQKAYRERKEHEWWMKSTEEWVKNGCNVG
jgi:hypothetical protein